MNENNRKSLNGLGLGVLVIIAVFIAVFLSFTFVLGYFAFVPIKNTNTKQYLETDGRKSSLVCFPGSLDGLNVSEYHYYDYRLLDGCEILLVVQYDANSFEREVERLRNISYHDSTAEFTKKVKIDDENRLFNTYTFVVVYNPAKNKYEYVCVNQNDFTIAYVYIGYLSSGKSIIDEFYLPKQYVNDCIQTEPYFYDIYADREDVWFEG